MTLFLEISADCSIDIKFSIYFQLVNLLKSNPVDEKEVHGYKVSSRVLKHLTAQEIRDLLVVFELFDSNADGYDHLLICNVILHI